MIKSGLRDTGSAATRAACKHETGCFDNDCFLFAAAGMTKNYFWDSSEFELVIVINDRGNNIDLILNRIGRSISIMQAERRNG